MLAGPWEDSVIHGRRASSGVQDKLAKARAAKKQKMEEALAQEGASSSRKLPTSSDQAVTPPELLASQQSEFARKDDVSSQEFLVCSDQAFTPPELLPPCQTELVREEASSSRELPTSSDQALTPPELLTHQQSEVGIGGTVVPVDSGLMPVTAFDLDALEEGFPPIGEALDEVDFFGLSEMPVGSPDEDGWLNDECTDAPEVKVGGAAIFLS